MRIVRPRPAERARSIPLRKIGVESGNGLASRIPERSTGMPRSAQNVAALLNRVMLRPGR